MRYIRLFAIALLFIGIAAVSITTLFGYNTIAFLERTRIEETGIWIYKYNFYSYYQNLQMSINDAAELILKTPTRTWYYTMDLTNWPDRLANNFTVILDYIILILNVIIYPLRVGAYMCQQTMAVLGINIFSTEETGIKWLVDLVRTLKGLQIPYL